MNMEIDSNGLDELKKITHHAEFLLDNDSYPEIQTVREVTVEPKNYDAISDITDVKVRMKLDLHDDADPSFLKRLEHHIEELLDLDNWPEIHSVYGVKSTEITD